MVRIFGAGGATGAAIARLFVREGLIARETWHHPEKLEFLVERIRTEGATACAFGSDARQEEQLADVGRRMVATISLSARWRALTSQVHFGVVVLLALIWYTYTRLHVHPLHRSLLEEGTPCSYSDN